MKRYRLRPRLIEVEELEQRLALSLIFDHDGHAPESADLAGANAGGNAPAIRLDLVALHEFGHSLGLGHTSDSSSIMYAYYNASYNMANFANDSAVDTLQSLYSGPNAGPWKDSLDPHPSDGTVEVTYSFIPDGAKLDSGKNNTLFATFNAIFGAGNWQSIFTGELDRWGSVSILDFSAHSDSGLAFNYNGAAQNDARSGDIRIGAHRFDNAGKVLAHTYFPPPNGSSAAGDSHYDNAEKWVLNGGAGGGGGGGGGGGNLYFGDATPRASDPAASAGAVQEDSPNTAQAEAETTNSPEVVTPVKNETPFASQSGKLSVLEMSLSKKDEEATDWLFMSLAATEPLGGFPQV